MRLDPRFADFHPGPDLLEGRVVLVTGAGDGIGRAIAHLCAAHGATSVLLGRTVEKLERVYDEIRAAGGPEPAIYPMDLSGAMPPDYEALAGPGWRASSTGSTGSCTTRPSSGTSAPSSTRRRRAGRSSSR